MPKNALAELAEREWSEADKDKARRIVAELANVTADYKCDPWQEFSIQAKYAVLRCRAIAEEKNAKKGKIK